MRDFILAAKAVADPMRIRILKMLEGGELCVCHIAHQLGLSESAASRHLSTLRQAGLVEARKQGAWVYCRLAERSFNPYAAAFLDLVAQALNEDPQIVADRASFSGCCQNER